MAIIDTEKTKKPYLIDRDTNRFVGLDFPLSRGVTEGNFKCTKTVIEAVKITYLRKPQSISLSLGLSCELPEHNHQEVVDMTVSSILEAFQDSRYQTNQIEEAKNK